MKTKGLACCVAITAILAGCSQETQTTIITSDSVADQANSYDLKREQLGGELSTAALFGDKVKVVELLDKGVDVNRLSVGWTPLDIAIKHEHQELVTLLRERGGKTATELGLHPDRENPAIRSVSTTASVTFTRSSTGYDWQRSDTASKQQFCETIATAMSKEFKRNFSPDFYLEALNSFYSTSDPNIQKQNIHSIVGLVTSAAMN